NESKPQSHSTWRHESAVICTKNQEVEMRERFGEPQGIPRRSKATSEKFPFTSLIRRDDRTRKSNSSTEVVLPRESVDDCKNRKYFESKLRIVRLSKGSV